jgi:hypothetical protein
LSEVRLTFLILAVLALALAAGCGAGDDTVSDAEMEQAVENLTGGTWELPDGGGDELNFRPNGTGQAYSPATDINAEIAWTIEAARERIVLTWTFAGTDPEDARKWVVEIEAEEMRVWPIAGSSVLLDPDSDDPYVLVRVD